MATGKLSFSTSPTDVKLKAIRDKLEQSLLDEHKDKLVILEGTSIVVRSPVLGTELFKMGLQSEKPEGIFGPTMYYYILPSGFRNMLNWEGLGQYFKDMGGIEYPSSAVGGYRKGHRTHHKRNSHRKRNTRRNRSNRRNRKTRRN